MTLELYLLSSYHGGRKIELYVFGIRALASYIETYKRKKNLHVDVKNSLIPQKKLK